MASPRSCAVVCGVLFLCLVSPGEAFPQHVLGNLADSSLHADYVIVTPPEFLPALGPFAEYRTAKNGFTVAVVLLDSIVAQFPEGGRDSSLRSFIGVMRTRWTPPVPSYLLLAGDAGIVPTHQSPSDFQWYGEDSVQDDEWLVDSLTTGASPVNIPRMALGRLPGKETTDIAAMTAKIIAYEETKSASWFRRTIAVADSQDGVLFEPDARAELAGGSALWPDTLLVSVDTTSPSHKSSDEFVELWNGGAAVVDFVGHVNAERFTSGGYFSVARVPSISAGFPSLVLYRANQRFDTLSMAVQLMRAPQGGAIATIAPSGLAYENYDHQFVRALFASLSDDPVQPIGVALQAVKKSPAFAGLLPIRTYTLLGDPALVIKSLDLLASTSVSTPQPAGFALFQNYPNPFNPTTVVSFQVPVVSPVKLAVYDLLGHLVTLLVDEKMEPGIHRVVFNAAGLASGVYFCRLQAGSFTQTSRLLLIR